MKQKQTQSYEILVINSIKRFQACCNVMRQRDEAGKMYFYTAKIHPKTQTSKILSGPLGEGFLMKDWTGHF